MSINAQLYAEAAVLQKKWGDFGLLEGIDDPEVKRTTSILLENQHLLNESLTATSDVDQFRRISIPLVRRIYPQLIANKIVSVQPLLGPTGLVYYLRFRYATTKGQNVYTGGGYPGDDSSSMQQLADGTANLYTYYSHQRVESEGHGAVASDTAVALLHTPVILANSIEYVGGYTGALKAPVSAYGKITKGSGLVYDFVVKGGGGSTIGTNFDVTQSAGTPTDHGISAITLGSTGITFSYGGSEISTLTITYEYNMECNTDLPEVNLAVESEEIAAKTRKLKAVWSFEAQQDLRSQHNLDAEAELTAVLAQEINLEIDREILLDIRRNAGTIATWDLKAAAGITIKEKYESLYVKVVEVSNIIHRKTLRGGANWIVTSPEVSAIFETATAGFAPAPSNTFTTTLGIQYIGTVNNRWKLYRDPLFPSNELCMGYRGDSYMDSGYFYCPYVPLTQTPVVLDPESFCPRKGILTRYGKKMLREGRKFYARINIENFSI